MYRGIVICSKNGLYSQFRKEADFTPARQILFYIFSLFIGNCNRPRPPHASCLQAIMRLQKPIKFVSCGLNRVLIYVTRYCR